ncbi:hypothetical protein HYFRA_00009673 [Hymenoscyphus fraxineus]|uniref:Uncharacterized protein n=1 Tax=Hymenoscyphus fraxineus TaxID=746836 RepID=A0A9N9PSJ2_9HELO|nr:hypothetical protein HYFRA_00009673 [Hymenoscyphus fraxineus]
MRFSNVPSVVLLLASILSVEAGPLPANGVQPRRNVHGTPPAAPPTEGKRAIEERDAVMSGASDESPAVKRSLLIHIKRDGYRTNPKEKRGRKPTPAPKPPNPLIIHKPNNKRTLTSYFSRNKRSDGEGPEATIEERNPGKEIFGRAPAKGPKKPANPLIIHGSSKRTLTSYLSTDKRDGDRPEAIKERNPGKEIFSRAPAKGPKKPPNPLVISNHSKRKATSYLSTDKRDSDRPEAIKERNLGKEIFGRAPAKGLKKPANPLVISNHSKRKATSYLSTDKRDSDRLEAIKERNLGKEIFGRAPAKGPKKPANPLIISTHSKRKATSYLSTDKRDSDRPEAIKERNLGKEIFGRAPAKGPKKPPNPLVISNHSKRKATSYLLPEKRSGGLQIPKGPGIPIGERNLGEGVFGRADAPKNSANTGNPLIIRSESKIASALSAVKRWSGLLSIEKRDPENANEVKPAHPPIKDGVEKRWNGLLPRSNSNLESLDESSVSAIKRNPKTKPDPTKLHPGGS